jgi:acyl-CoA reductase-like NAD-dependent aldehyde dehydrogenase
MGYDVERALQVGRRLHPGDGCDGKPTLGLASGQMLGDLPLATTATLDLTLDSADRGFRPWRETVPQARSGTLLAIPALLRERVGTIDEAIADVSRSPHGLAAFCLLRDGWRESLLGYAIKADMVAISSGQSS